MDPRLDTAFESWGGFSTNPDGTSPIHGLLRYDPDKHIELELAVNPGGIESLVGRGEPLPETLYGQLSDGTLVTLLQCFVTNGSFTFGVDVCSPTKIHVGRAMFGGLVADIDHLLVKTCSLELTSLSNWIAAAPVRQQIAEENGRPVGFDLQCRPTPPIHVQLPAQAFDVKIGQDTAYHHQSCSTIVQWRASAMIVAHDSLVLKDAMEVGWQTESLMSLLVGHRISVKHVTLETDQVIENANGSSLQLLYCQRGKHNHPDVHPAEMLLPYPMIKDQVPQIMERWFGRSEQAVLATNVFFGSETFESPAVNVKFLALAQAAESYHRSFGTGFYMNQAAYDEAIQQFATHMPVSIQNEHRQSLKNRLKYGNEVSLRRRLTDMFSRIPQNVRSQIAADVSRFVSKVVDTRNYYTHYDAASKANALDGKDAYVAAERVRVLVVANLLHDLGIADDKLLEVLRRNRNFQHWMQEPLAL
jgi:hypothetical protein